MLLSHEDSVKEAEVGVGRHDIDIIFEPFPPQLFGKATW